MGQGGFDSGPPGDSDLISNSGWETVVGRTEGTDAHTQTHTQARALSRLASGTQPLRSPAASSKASCCYCCRRATLCITAYNIPPRVLLWLSATSGVSCYIMCPVADLPVVAGDSNGRCTRTYGGMTRRCSKSETSGPKVGRKNIRKGSKKHIHDIDCR